MNIADICRLRLENQQLSMHQFSSVQDVVRHMGATQAQDFPMAKLALCMRVPEGTVSMVEEALNAGSVLRTHVLRPTWHIVAAEDIRWMTELTATRIKAHMATNNRKLGLDDAIFRKSNALIEKAFSDVDFLDRTEIQDALTAGGILLGENRLSHILENAELDQVICSGAIRKGKATYALLDRRVKRTKPKKKDEALYALAERYFTSHAPATLRDFSWWSGLSLTEAKMAVNMLGEKLLSEEVGGQTYHIFPGEKGSPAASQQQDVFFLPAFDEFVIAYADRSVVINQKHITRAISQNGIFKPVLVHKERVIGTWKRSVHKNTATIEAEYFFKKDKLKAAQLKNAGKKLNEMLL
ncbi:MAG: AlkZ family DNA glycosylase [Mucilaginibacter polytrichastri]|nr:AlkZ family DNA glycosylase [Mucilaginibacter polytrichastri]